MERNYNELEKLIRKSGLTSVYIYEHMGIKRSRFQQLKKNPDCMNIKQMEDIAEILGVEFYDIYLISKKFRSEVA